MAGATGAVVEEGGGQQQQPEAQPQEPPRERALFLPLRDGVCDVVIGAWYAWCV